MGMFWDAIRSLELHYQSAVQENNHEYAAGILEAINCLHPTEWLKVQDELPSDTTDVWVWDGKNITIDNFKASRSNYGHVINGDGQVVATTGWWHHYAVCDATPKVTHWMPIPKPDKPQE